MKNKEQCALCVWPSSHICLGRKRSWPKRQNHRLCVVLCDLAPNPCSSVSPASVPTFPVQPSLTPLPEQAALAASLASFALTLPRLKLLFLSFSIVQIPFFDKILRGDPSLSLTLLSYCAPSKPARSVPVVSSSSHGKWISYSHVCLLSRTLNFLSSECMSCFLCSETVQ